MWAQQGLEKWKWCQVSRTWSSIFFFFLFFGETTVLAAYLTLVRKHVDSFYNWHFSLAQTRASSVTFHRHEQRVSKAHKGKIQLRAVQIQTPSCFHFEKVLRPMHSGSFHISYVLAACLHYVICLTWMSYNHTCSKTKKWLRKNWQLTKNHWVQYILPFLFHWVCKMQISMHAGF